MATVGVAIGGAAFIGFALLFSLRSRRVHRTRAGVIGILERGLATGGDSQWDDFVSVRIAEPELEAVRLRCLEVNLAPKAAFEQTLRKVIAELRGLA